MQNYVYPENNKEEQQLNEDIMMKSEKYNCSKIFVRPSTDKFPATQHLQQSLKFPLTALIQPYAETDSQDPLPTSSFGNQKILRCERCRAYVNPFTKFLNDGKRFQCNICSEIDNTPEFYQLYWKNIKRVELEEGAYEFKAGQEFIFQFKQKNKYFYSSYMFRPPVPPTYCFLIDVSQEAIEAGLLEISINAIKEVIQNDLLAGGPRAQYSLDWNFHL